MDAVVLKAVALTLQTLFSVESYPHCTHLKGAGGIHSAIKETNKNQSSYQHILKSDAYHYYESIDHQVLLVALEREVKCPILLDLVSQYCQRLEIKEGNYYSFQRGIPKGCPLSPLMAALYLKPLDDELSKHGFYVRFMDDWIIMVKTKHQLRQVIKLTHKILTKLKLKMHPDKTFLGCIKKGFDFLGVHFGDEPKMSKTSLENYRSKLAQRYAQGASAACIGHYIARWTSWCAGVLKCCRSQFSVINSIGQETSRQLGLINLPKENNHENCYVSPDQALPSP
jgi:RNA-directed DNA polymerase